MPNTRTENAFPGAHKRSVRFIRAGAARRLARAGARRGGRSEWDEARGRSPRKIQCFDTAQASATAGKLHFL